MKKNGFHAFASNQNRRYICNCAFTEHSMRIKFNVYWLIFEMWITISCCAREFFTATELRKNGKVIRQLHHSKLDIATRITLQTFFARNSLNLRTKDICVYLTNCNRKTLKNCESQHDLWLNREINEANTNKKKLASFFCHSKWCANVNNSTARIFIALNVPWINN